MIRFWDSKLTGAPPLLSVFVRRPEGCVVVDALSWELLNATADDWESLDQLHPAACRFFGPVDRSAVAVAVAELVAAGLFEQRPADAPVSDGWFRMTAAGRSMWEQAADRCARQAEPLYGLNRMNKGSDSGRVLGDDDAS